MLQKELCAAEVITFDYPCKYYIGKRERTTFLIQKSHCQGHNHVHSVLKNQ